MTTENTSLRRCLFILTAVILAGCSITPPEYDFLPDRISPATRSVDARLASVLVAPYYRQENVILNLNPDEQKQDDDENRVRMLDEIPPGKPGEPGFYTAWQIALKDMLSRKAVFSEHSERKIAVRVTVLDVRFPTLATLPVSTTRARYSVIDLTQGRIVYETTIDSSGQAEDFEFAGAIRHRRALNATVGDSIARFAAAVEYAIPVITEAMRQQE